LLQRAGVTLYSLTFDDLRDIIHRERRKGAYKKGKKTGGKLRKGSRKHPTKGNSVGHHEAGHPVWKEDLCQGDDGY